jgi:ribosomal protein L24E
MPKCVYCGKTYEYPRGITFVMKDGVVKPLCSSKCKKNMEMKRRKVRWIKVVKKVKTEAKIETK